MLMDQATETVRTLETTEKPNEGDLVRRLRAGENEAFEHLVREQCPRMLAVARRLLNDEDDARDAVQNAFISAFRHVHRFEQGAKLSTWLHRITVNEALMIGRKRRRKREQAVEHMPADLSTTGGDERLRSREPRSDSPIDQLVAAESAAHVHVHLQQLPPDYRTVIQLRDIEQRDTADTARRLRISVNAVKTRLYRARRALKDLMEQPGGSAEAM